MKILGRKINLYALFLMALLILAVFIIYVFHGRQVVVNQEKDGIGKPDTFVKNIQKPFGLTLGYNRVFAQNSYDGKISAIDVDGKVFDYTYLYNYQGYGFEIEKNGNFLMAGGSEVIRINSSGSVLQSYSGFSQAYDVEMASNGTIFVSDSIDNTIYKISSEGEITKLITFESRKSDSILNVAGIRLDKKSKNLYAVNMFLGDLYKIELTDDYEANKVSAVASGLKRPNFLDLDSEGNVYISCLGDNTIVRVDQNSIVETIDTEGKLSVPTGIVLMEGQNDSATLYVASHDSNRIFKIQIGIKNKTKK